jgi:hypothetical protein
MHLQYDGITVEMSLFHSVQRLIEQLIESELLFIDEFGVNEQKGYTCQRVLRERKKSMIKYV